ncbi:MAG: PEF-CTERM sorting domain-containing protein [Halobacteriota archaeon]|nr:PEF-CTERM sorting domain-containing protein [Halobacteriota archaeon]
MKIGQREIIAILVVLSIFGGLLIALPLGDEGEVEPLDTMVTSETSGQYPDTNVNDEEDESSATDGESNTTAKSGKILYSSGSGGYSSGGVGGGISAISTPTPVPTDPSPDPVDPTPDPTVDPTPDPVDPTPDPTVDPTPDPVDPEEIPEFPTVAIPAAMILGLVFLMQRRKN